MHLADASFRHVLISEILCHMTVIPKHHKLAQSFLAAMICGLRRVSTPQRKFLIFPIHLPSVAVPPELCQALFQTVETHIEGRGHKKRSSI